MRGAGRVVWVAIVVVGLALAGCDSAEQVEPASGTLTFRNDQGADFLRGVVQDPGNFQNSDLYASYNGGNNLKLATGGANPTVNRPVTWFKNAGNVPQKFDSLAEVPTDLPPDEQPQALLTTQVGNGFVLQRKDGGYTRGWIQAASGTEVTIQFDPVE